MVADQIPQLAELVNSDIYRRALNWHLQRGLKLVAMDPGIALALAAKAVVASGRNVADLVHALEASPLAFNTFVSSKLAAFTGDDEEEYPRGERPPKDERPKTLEILGYPESFLVAHLCEFTIAGSSPGELEEYAKRYRLPKAKKYAKEVLGLFKQVKANAKETTKP